MNRNNKVFLMDTFVVLFVLILVILFAVVSEKFVKLDRPELHSIGGEKE